jgi:hypothetical protein
MDREVTRKFIGSPDAVRPIGVHLNSNTKTAHIGDI